MSTNENRLKKGILQFDNVSSLSDWFVFFMVLIIGTSKFAENCWGINSRILLAASQSNYLTNIIQTAATIANAILLFIIVKAGGDVFAAKSGNGQDVNAKIGATHNIFIQCVYYLGIIGPVLFVGWIASLRKNDKEKGIKVLTVLLILRLFATNLLFFPNFYYYLILLFALLYSDKVYKNNTVGEGLMFKKIKNAITYGINTIILKTKYGKKIKLFGIRIISNRTKIIIRNRGSISFGKGSRVCEYSTISSNRASIIVGENVGINKNMIMSSHGRIEIGRGTLFAPNVCSYES